MKGWGVPLPKTLVSFERSWRVRMPRAEPVGQPGGAGEPIARNSETLFTEPKDLVLNVILLVHLTSALKVI